MYLPRFLSPGLVVFFLTAASVTGQASLYVSESFDYSGVGNDATMNGVNVSNGTSTGLSGDYSVVSAGSGSVAKYVSTGLTFAGTNFHATSGGAVSLVAVGGNASTRSVLSVSLNDGAVTGDVYSSYLFQITAASNKSNATAQMWTADTAGTGATNTHFLTMPEGNNSLSSAEKIQAGYNSATSTSTSTPAVLSLNTTYLAIAKFTNVGDALSVDTPGVASFWIMDLAGYNAWVAGGSVEADLTANSLNFVTNSVTSGTYNLNGFQTFAVTTPNTSGTTGQTVIFDELLLGSTLDSITAVPEPTTIGMAVAGILILAIWSHRSRKLAFR